MPAALFRRIPTTLLLLSLMASCGPLSRPPEDDGNDDDGGGQPQQTLDLAAYGVEDNVLARTSRSDGIGMIVSMVDSSGRRVYSIGYASDDQERRIDADTVFEIGSVTKTFTGVLVADFVERGLLILEEPAEAYLPDGEVDLPEFGGVPISVEHLATHTSAFPQYPDNIQPEDSANPFADYTVEDLYEFASHYALDAAPGTIYEYSNVGYGLLGHVLVGAAGVGDYEQLVLNRLTIPLGMNSTRIDLTSDLEERMATGHYVDEEVAALDLPAIEATGAFKSSANDLMTFLEANLGLRATELNSAMTLSHQPRFGTDEPSKQIGLGWMITTGYIGPLIWHAGVTNGFHSFIGFTPVTQTGVVVLTNSRVDVVDIGLHLLDPNIEVKSDAAAVIGAEFLDIFGGAKR